MGKNKKIVFGLIVLIMILVFACSKENSSDSTVMMENEFDSLLTADSENGVLASEYLGNDEEDVIDSAWDSEHNSKGPCLSIIIDDFGNYNNFMLDSLLVKYDELPSEVVFAILPNLPYSEFVMEYCQESSRDLFLHAPMQPLNTKINAGDQVVSSGDDAITIINKLNNFYSQIPHIIGLNNHMGSKATGDSEVMSTVLEWCKSNNLIFVDSATIGNSIAYQMAKDLGVLTARRNIFLDVPNPSRETVDNYLEKMKSYYQSQKDILVITHASSLERKENLQYFIDECSKIGYELIRISDFTKRDRAKREETL